MKFFSNAIDRFCYKHPRFGIKNLMLYIVIGTAIVYIMGMMDTTGTFLYYLYFNPALILHGQIWRIVTFLFVPTTSGILWVAIMLYFYYFIGSSLEREWGSAKFTLYYICGVVVTIIYGMIAGLLTDSTYMLLDSTYINLSMFFAFAVLFPDVRVLLFFIIPVKMKWLAIIDAVFFAYSIVIGTFPGNLLPLIALLNFFLFCGGYFSDFIKPIKARNSRASVNFRRQTQSAQYENAQKPYRHKCSVCGKTDTDYPNMQFRYCSRCQGYHCFCEEHINNHIHFQ